MRKERIIILLVVATVIALCLLLAFGQCRAENGCIRAAWQKRTGRPYIVDGKVHDSHGQPLIGADVDVVDDSGGGVATTDSNGTFSVELSESSVKTIEIDGVGSISFEIYGFGGVDCRDGVTFDLLAKRANASGNRGNRATDTGKDGKCSQGIND